jgi:subtilase family serine protease
LLLKWVRKMCKRSSSALGWLFSTIICLINVTAPAHAAQLVARTVATDAVGDSVAINADARPAPNAVFHLTFSLTTSSSATAASFVSSLTDPHSPNYHKWITPTQFGERFGASISDINAVKDYLSTLGLTNIKVWPDRSFISAFGRRSDIEAGFHVAINGYNRSSAGQYAGLSATYYAPDHDPVMPSSIANRLNAIFGLSSAVEHRPTGISRSFAAPEVGQAPLNPAQLAQVYDIAPLHSNNLTGQGQTIAIYSPTAFRQSDINSFLTANNISSATVNVINVDGGTTSLTYQDEACVDIETSIGQAPSATVDVYEGPNDGSLDIWEQIESDGPTAVSCSWGTPESQVNIFQSEAYGAICQALSAEGTSVFVATGDSGAYWKTNPIEIGCTMEATSAFVTAVGGTELDDLNNGNWDGEIAWSYNDGTAVGNDGSNGGLSIYVDEPSWQTGPGVSNSNSNGMRQIPDVAALASTPYYSICSGGSFGAFYGTSCSTPLWASAMSLIAEALGGRIGNIDPTLYDIGTNDASVYHDITAGNNGVYDCTTGWDFVTGWGSADFDDLYGAFQSDTLPYATAPTMSPNGGSFGSVPTVTLSDSQNGVTMYYTTNGTTPTTSSNQYTGPFTVTRTNTVEAVAVASGYTTSLVTSAPFYIVLPMPTISPNGGNFASAQTVTMTDSQSGVSIYYTVDGTTPTNLSTRYTAPITVSTGETVQAIAFEFGFTTSSATSATFTFGTPASAPTISPSSGSFTTPQTVSITDSQNGTSIYYTSNGTTPSTNSTLYTGAFTVSSSETIEAIAAASGYANSSTTSAVFTIAPVIPTPSISPGTGTYTIAQSVTVSDSQNGVTIYYTTNGTTPTTSSTQYTGAFTVSSSETVEAIAVESAYTNSNIASTAITIAPIIPMPAISPNAGVYTTPQTVTISDSQNGVTIYYTTNGSTPTTSSNQYSGTFTVSTSETVEAIAVESGYTNSGTSSAAYIIAPVIPTPTISPAGGTYTTSQSVTISESQTGTTIFYTTNGTTPTTSSTHYTGAFTVSSSETVEAIAVESGYTNSTTSSAVFTILPVIPTPTISPISGTYTTAQTVSISDSQSGVTIYYTTNGTTPTTSSAQYTGSFTVSTTETVEAIAVENGYTNSGAASSVFNIAPLVPTPTISPSSGTYTTAQSVTISDTLSGATIYFTTNGTIPTTSSSQYAAPITVSNTELVEAIAVQSGYTNSSVGTASFTISPVIPTPTISPAGGTFTTTQSVTIGDSQSGASIYYTTNGSTPTTSSTLYSGAFNVSSSETVQAIAAQSSYTNSAPASASFTIAPVIPTPTISPSSGTYTTTQTITISESQNGAAIYYTTNGSMPTTSSTHYTGPFSALSSETIEAIAVETGYTNSSVTTASLTIAPVIPTPVINPVSGTYTTAQTATITDSQSGVTIYCTTDGSTPTINSTHYTGAFSVSASKTIEAIAIESGYTVSASATSSIVISPVLSTPTITPAGGSFTSSISVTISDAQSSAAIYYTVDGSTPSAASTLYTGPITVSSTQTVQAVAIESGYTNSTIAEAVFTLNFVLPAPTIQPNGGTFTSSQAVTITDFQGGATLYFTTNGSTPATSSQHYTGPITVSSSETLKAIAVESGYTNSSISSAAFNIDPVLPTPVISPVSGTYVNAQTVTISDSQNNVAIYCTTDGSTPTINSPLYTGSFTVSAPEDVQAIAVESSYTNSAVASTEINIAPLIPAPTVSPNGGSFTTSQSVTLADSQTGSSIYYTTNGTTPTTSSTPYTGAFTLSSTSTVEAIAVESGYTQSPVSMAVFTIVRIVPMPTISPSGGTFSTSQAVTLSDSQSGTTIYYTSDGSVPTTSSSRYTVALNVSTSLTIKALAAETGYTNSSIASASFTMYPVIPTPTITPGGGSFEVAQSVRITDSRSGVTIYYSTDGATPSSNSTPYSGPFTVSTSETVQAIAVETGYTQSGVAVSAITINSVLTSPIISPNGGTFTSSQTVSLTDSQSGAQIYYTSDGSAPTTNSTLYTAPLTVASSETITAIAMESGFTTSNAAMADFIIHPILPTPTISPNGGTFSAPQVVTLADIQLGANLYYTTDGSTPTTQSTLYSGPFTISSTQTINVIATDTGFTNSSVATAQFSITAVTPAPTFSPYGGSYSGNLPLTIADSLPTAKIYYTTDGSVPTTQSTLYTSPLPVTQSVTVSAIAVAPNYQISPVSTITITVKVSLHFGAGLQMISLPTDESGVSLDTLFGYTGVKLAVWNPLADAYAVTPEAPANQVQLGTGYWVRFPQAVSVALNGPPAPTSQPFEISLQAGWNMIGDPFNASIPLQNVTFNDGSETFAQGTANANPLIYPTLYSYTAGSSSYTSANSLSPGLGYWVYAYQATTMDVPPPNPS